MVSTSEYSPEAQQEAMKPATSRRHFLRTSLLQTSMALATAALMHAPIVLAEDPKAAERIDEAEFARLSVAAKEYIRENLHKNRVAAKIYQEMLPQIHEFSKYAKVEPVVFKCMDGRTQTNDHKGIPPTVAINRRS